MNALPRFRKSSEQHIAGNMAQRLMCHTFRGTGGNDERLFRSEPYRKCNHAILQSEVQVREVPCRFPLSVSAHNAPALWLCRLPMLFTAAHTAAMYGRSHVLFPSGRSKASLLLKTTPGIPHSSERKDFFSATPSFSAVREPTCHHVRNGPYPFFMERERK